MLGFWCISSTKKHRHRINMSRKSGDLFDNQNTNIKLQGRDKDYTLNILIWCSFEGCTGLYQLLWWRLRVCDYAFDLSNCKTWESLWYHHDLFWITSKPVFLPVAINDHDFFTHPVVNHGCWWYALSSDTKSPRLIEYISYYIPIIVV